MSLGDFSRDSAETINLRGSDIQGRKWEDEANHHTAAQRAASFNTSYEAPSNAGMSVLYAHCLKVNYAFYICNFDYLFCD